MIFIWSLIKEWTVFLIHPKDLIQDMTPKQKIKSVTFHFFFLFLISVSLMILIQFLLRYLFLWHIIPYPVIHRHFYDITFLIVVIIGPIKEELVFRLSLRFKPLFLAISMSVLLFFIVVRKIIGTDPFFNIWYTLGNLFIILGMLIILYFLLRLFNNTLTRFWNKHFRLIFYILAIVFGYWHLWNYYLCHYSIILLSPLFILPYIFIGVNLGYIRLKYGIFFSILLHGFYNSIPYILPFIFHAP